MVGLALVPTPQCHSSPQPCSVPAVWIGKGSLVPGPCPGTGSSSAAHTPQVKQHSTRNGVGQAGISVNFSTM